MCIAVTRFGCFCAVERIHSTHESIVSGAHSSDGSVAEARCTDGLAGQGMYRGIRVRLSTDGHVGWCCAFTVEGKSGANSCQKA